MIQDYDAIVIGGGKGGKTLATDLGGSGIRTALIERDPEMIGGGCINLACIPTKTFVASARAAFLSRESGRYGVRNSETTVDWQAVKARVREVVLGMRKFNEANFRRPPALDFIIGTGRFTGPHEVEVTGPDGTVRQLRSSKIFINTGTRPARRPLPGIESIGALALDSTTVQRLDELPAHLVILGGSYIALEFSQIFRRLGSKVTVIERNSQIVAREDADVATALKDILVGEGIDIRLGAKLENIESDPAGVAVVIRTGPETGAETQRVTGSHLLVALGREAVTDGLNPEAAGVELDKRGFVKVNEHLETTAPGIWAIGDIAGGPQFTHVSLDDYRILRANVFGNSRFTTKGRLIPSSMFTDPELARVGITEKEAHERGIPVHIAKIPAGSIPRAKTTGHTAGLVKAVIDAKTERILGCTILADGAGESISCVQIAMLADWSFTRLADTILTHPTMTEGFNMLFAGVPKSA